MITRLRKAMYAQLVPFVPGFVVLAAIIVERFAEGLLHHRGKSRADRKDYARHAA